MRVNKMLANQILCSNTRGESISLLQLKFDVNTNTGTFLVEKLSSLTAFTKDLTIGATLFDLDLMKHRDIELTNVEIDDIDVSGVLMAEVLVPFKFGEIKEKAQG